MTISVLPSMDNVGNKDIATFNLNSDIPASLASEFEANLARVIQKINPYLIVINIKDGEPSWLSTSLSSIQKRFISDLIVCPTAKASNDTLAAVKLIQTAGTLSKTNTLGLIF